MFDWLLSSFENKQNETKLFIIYLDILDVNIGFAFFLKMCYNMTWPYNILDIVYWHNGMEQFFISLFT